MRRLEIEDVDVMRVAVQQEIGRSEESRYDHRLHGILLIRDGHGSEEVAELFGEDRRTVQRWVQRFRTRGFAGLRDGERPGRPRSLSAEEWEAVGEDLRRPPREFGFAQTLWEGKLLSEHLRRRYKVKIGVRQCQRMFSQMGFRLRKPRPQVAQADPAAQRIFKKLRRIAQDPTVELWSLDECHFQQHGTRTRMWVPPEVRDPVLVHAPTRKSVACFGAVQIGTGKLVCTLAEVFNAVTFEDFLRRLLRHRGRGKRMVVILDNAKYHHARLLEPLLRKHRRTLTLLFLPPYSPQLNPIERVWKLARRLATHNRYFATLEELVSAVTERFTLWLRPNSALRTLCGVT